MGYQSDNYYIDKVLNGDTNAYASLVDKHKDMVFTICKKITGNREDAEEIAQDSFLKAFQHLGKFRKESKFSTWIYRIAYNSAISKTRKKTLKTRPIENAEMENLSIDDEINNVIDEKNELQKKKLIEKALTKLNELDYLIITLFYMNDKSVEEISEITGLSGSNVKVKLFRIRKKIYAELYAMIGANVKLLAF